VKAERKRIIKNKEKDLLTARADQARKPINISDDTAIERERKQLAKIEARQQHEIEQMLAYEQQVRQRQEEAARKVRLAR